MEPREIPGYYYDPDKKKYFKVEKNAPATAAYSAESVKRRKLEQDQAERARIIEDYKKKSVRRSRTLQDPLLGGFLARQLGLHVQDLQVDCWARGLCSKGDVLIQDYPRDNSQVEHLYIGNADEKSELGVAIGSMHGSLVYGAFIPRDEHKRIVTDTTAPFWMQKGRFLRQAPQISSLKYHQPSNRILITSRDPGNEGGLYSLTFYSADPNLASPDDPSPPGWDLRRPKLNRLHNWSRQARSAGHEANTCAPAPASNSNLVCVVGTSRGLGCYSGNGQMLWLENLASAPPRPRAAAAAAAAAASDVLSVDFLPHNPQVVVAGVRGPRKICLADLRQPAREWDWMVHRSSPAHVRCLDEHRVLAAGPDHSMSVYDLRFRHREAGRNRPVVVFPQFRNDARIHFGLDVDVSLGIVAAADCGYRGRQSQQGGSTGMGLFSLQTGKRLQVPALLRQDDISQQAASSPPEALAFHTLPGETNASLFVGCSGGRVKKFSFGGDVDEWTGERFDPLPASESAHVRVR